MGVGVVIWEIVYFLNAQIWMLVHIEFRTKQFHCQLLYVEQVSLPPVADYFYSNTGGWVRDRNARADVKFSASHYKGAIMHPTDDGAAMRARDPLWQNTPSVAMDTAPQSTPSVGCWVMRILCSSYRCPGAF